ncbi:MAG TPA: hypothetical protein VGQ22_20160 [Steroidobacteraceae bacterium]|jgi:hypothetical protein|nr:hypothetical protein [Steroidobacteraceae bacterium]
MLLAARLTRSDSSLRTVTVTCQRDGGEESAFTKLFFRDRQRKRFQRTTICRAPRRAQNESAFLQIIAAA